jgi:2-keto-4-pentenoate hydratase
LAAPRTLIDELISLHEFPREVPPFSDRYSSLTPNDGYSAAAALHAHRLAAGWQPVGRKIGFTNRTIWPRYGVYEPIWGTIYDRTLVYAVDGHSTVPLAGLVNPRIELEICLHLKSAPRQSGEPEQLLGSIDWIAHAVRSSSLAIRAGSSGCPIALQTTGYTAGSSSVPPCR